MGLTSTISGFYVKESVLDNLGGPDLISWKALRAKRGVSLRKKQLSLWNAVPAPDWQFPACPGSLPRVFWPCLASSHNWRSQFLVINVFLQNSDWDTHLHTRHRQPWPVGQGGKMLPIDSQHTERKEEKEWELCISDFFSHLSLIRGWVTEGQRESRSFTPKKLSSHRRKHYELSFTPSNTLWKSKDKQEL